MCRSRKNYFIAKRIAEELKDGDVVNLGPGLPRLVADYVVDKDVKIIFQSENGIVGLGSDTHSIEEEQDVTVFEAMEVDEKGNLAGIGSALVLLKRTNKVIIAMTHTSNDGSPKILRECGLALTAAAQVDLIVTDLGVIEVTQNGLLLKEMAPGVGLEDILSKTEADLFISDELKTAASI